MLIADLLVKIIQAFLLAIIAGVGAWIAYRQLVTAKLKLQFDLFDRRFKIYDIIHKFAWKAGTRIEVEDEEVSNLADVLSPSVFLFGDEVAEYTKVFKAKAFLLRYHSRSSDIDGEVSVRDWFLQQPDEIIRPMFQRYLNLQGASHSAGGHVWRGKILHWRQRVETSARRYRKLWRWWRLRFTRPGA